MSIEDAQRRLAEKLMRRRGVSGVAIGARDGAPCLKVYLSSRSPDLRARIPKSFQGHPVVVRESGEFRAQEADEK